MRIAIILLLVGFLQTQANDAYSQNTKLSISFSNTELAKVLDKIENLSEFYFLYNEKLIDATRKVSIEAKDERIEEVLKNIFSGTDVEYTITDRKIILAPAYLSESQQQGKKVTGKVTDQTGASLPGVSVVVKGTTTGVITDNNGNYSLANIPENSTLQFSFVGMKSQDVAVGNKAAINVVLKEETIALDEVVAIGYGTVKKKDATGSMEQLTSTTIGRTVNSNVEDALKGQFAGASVRQSGGANPSGGSYIRIRGYNSINQDANKPLYIVNGMPVSDAGIDNIDPGNIESVNILKDASATAIYGSRAAGGVIIINTKKGIKGEAIFNAKVQTGIQNPINVFDMCNSQEFYKLVEQGWDNQFTQAQKLTNKAYNAYYSPVVYDTANKRPLYDFNWGEAFLNNNAPWNKYSFGVTGGKEDFNYYLNSSIEDRDGVLIGSNVKRYSLNASFDVKISSKFRAGVSFDASLLKEKRRVDTDDVWAGNQASSYIQTVFTPHWVPNVDTNGEVIDLANLSKSPNGWGLTPGQLATIDAASVYASVVNWNKLYQTSARKYNTNTGRLISNVYAEYEPIQKLVFKLNAGVDITYIDLKNQDGILPKVYALNESVYIRRQISLRNNYLMEFTGRYNWNFGKDHEMNVLFGTSIQQDRSDYMYQQAWGSKNNLLNELGNMPLTRTLSTGLQVTSSSPNGMPSEFRLGSYFGRFNYTFRGKYLLTATVRRDGSSRFTGKNQYGTFPSVGLAWNMKEESFMSKLDWIQSSKLRASWGLTGNQSSVAQNMYVSQTNTSTNVFGVAVSPRNFGNPDIRWESIEQYNAGLDLELFKGRISTSFDIYRKVTKDMLGDIPLNPASGFSNMAGNLGSMENKGFEISIKSVNISKNDFSWTSNFVLSHNRNKILDLGTNPDGSKKDNIFVGSRNILKIGEPLQQFYLYQSTGIWQVEDAAEAAKFAASSGNIPGSERFLDVNGDHVYNNSDRVVMASPHPKFAGGFSNTLNYKDFSLSVLATYMYGHKIYNTNKELTEYGHPGFNKTKEYAANAWTAVNRNNKFPLMQNYSYVQYGAVNSSNSRFLEDGSFIKISSISLGYSLPKQLISKANFKRATVSMSVTNPFVFTKYTGIDPETQTPMESVNLYTQLPQATPVTTPLGVDGTGYPNARYFTLSLDLDF